MKCPTCSTEMRPVGYWVDHCADCGTAVLGGAAGRRRRVVAPARAKLCAKLRDIYRRTMRVVDHPKGCRSWQAGRDCDCYFVEVRAALDGEE